MVSIATPNLFCRMHCLLKKEYKRANFYVKFYTKKVWREFMDFEIRQDSVMFVATYPNSSLYMLKFNPTGLKKMEYKVDREWMLTIAYYRESLDKYTNNEMIRRIASANKDRWKHKLPFGFEPFECTYCFKKGTPILKCIKKQRILLLVS